MQIKTIEKVVKAKMEEWLSTITDEKLRNDTRSSLLVTGGCFVSMFLGEPVNDYDVYITSMDVCNRLAIYYTRSFSSDITVLDGSEKEILIDHLKKAMKYKNPDDDVVNSYTIAINTLHDDQIKLYFRSASGGMRVNEKMAPELLNYTPVFFSPNAISLSNQLQIVLRFVGDAEHIHKNFDFIHPTNYFTYKEGFVRNLAAVESILTKQLRYQGSYYPVTSIIRAKKFTKRGFNISAGELLKIMFQISKLDLSDPNVLEEQLIGVDIAYFSILIDALRQKFKTDADFKLSTDYFNALIDKVFNEDNSEIN